MIPVTQTKMVVKNSKDEMIVRGNCLAACVASLFEIPITEVPNVEVLFHIEDMNPNYMVGFLTAVRYMQQANGE